MWTPPPCESATRAVHRVDVPDAQVPLGKAWASLPGRCRVRRASAVREGGVERAGTLGVTAVVPATVDAATTQHSEEERGPSSTATQHTNKDKDRQQKQWSGPETASGQRQRRRRRVKHGVDANLDEDKACTILNVVLVDEECAIMEAT